MGRYQKDATSKGWHAAAAGHVRFHSSTSTGAVGRLSRRSSEETQEEGGRAAVYARTASYSSMPPARGEGREREFTIGHANGY